MTWTEKIAPDETERFERYAQELRAIQKALAPDKAQRPQWRALHTKAHTAAVGELRVAAPAELRAGVFAVDRTWPVYLRFSNGSPGKSSDKRPDIRGIGLKLVGVPGKKLIPPLADAVTQDFLLIQTDVAGVRDPDEFLTLVRLSRKGQALLLPRLIGALGFRRAFAIARGFLKMPKVRSYATSPFFTAVPLQIGGEAVKLALMPKLDGAGAGAAGAATSGPSALRDDLVDRLAKGPMTWTLMAQRFVDEATTPIEDASVRWPVEKSPWVALGELVVPAQDVTGARGQEIEGLVESLSFDPWHALPDHRPLGSMMRARAPAYRESVLERGAAPEPTSVLAPAPPK
ncbi:MAG: hypothetical protein U1F43_16300 [Myxococcota bacterium]